MEAGNTALVNELIALEGNNGQNYQTGQNAAGASFINTYSNRLFGAPFQLLDSVDRRFPEINANLGNEYLRNFILNSPILHIRPGMPKYTGNINSTSLSEMAKNIYANIVTGQKTGSNISAGEAFLREIGDSFAFGSGRKLQSRMFGFRETYYEYIQNVNYMCRSVASYMNLIDGTEFPNGCFVAGNQWKTFDTLDWQDYRIGNEGNSDPLDQLKGYMGVIGDNMEGTAAGIVSTLIPADGLSDEMKEAMEQSISSSLLSQVSSKLSSVDFMVTPSQFTESYSNMTGDSFIEGMIDGIQQGVGTEIAWITNSNADTGIIDNLTSFLGDTVSTATEVLGGLVQPIAGGFTRNLFSGAIAALKGQKMIYPKIYKSSESHMDYQFSITLTTPYGDPYNYYMNIVVPLLHLIALVAPRMISANTVASPFLVQAYIPGMCTCQLGIIKDMTIVKNPTEQHVSVNGYPLTVKVEFTIEELYNAMAISPANDPASFLHNETLNDYLCNMAGLAPSVDTYVAQRQSMYQAVDRYFDQGLWAQDWFGGLVEGIENWISPGKSY